MAYHAIEIEEDLHPAVENGTARSAAGSIGEDQLGLIAKGKQFMPEGLTSAPRNHDEAGPAVADAGSHNHAVACCLASVKGRLEKEEESHQVRASSCTFFRISQVLREINSDAGEPELVSIGPYHQGKKPLQEFQRHKWFFLKSFLRRTGSNVESLIEEVAHEASSALHCYSELEMKLSGDFMEMMLLDGCFVVEFLLHIFRSDHANDKDDPILARPRIIPILIRDLLKLENQVPYSLLQKLFNFSSSTKIEARTRHFCMLALRAFNLAYPRPVAFPDQYVALPVKYTDLQYRHYDVIKGKEYKHLLDLFKFTLFLIIPVQRNDEQESRPSDQSIPCVTQLKPTGVKLKSEKTESLQKYRPSEQSIPCVTRLTLTGIKFKSKKTDSFLDISFRKRVLEIPFIAINEFMITVLINCIALEQCQESSSKHVTDYLSFMHCLINQPKDVSLLCSHGIISTLSHDDQYVVDLFNKLGKSIVFNVRDCYLSKQFGEVESYYYSNWAIMIRNYFSNPWTAISVFYAFVIFALTVAQTVYAVLGHR